ncbi:Hypothetical protein C882_0396 [Caenispirillum salinarum AK4]|uniref:DUF1365 domain-containing protein n=1 Tax=Caenispirillum salinarum AK4 TaxID=1238182 RepID=K9GXS8_9PROT|nr:DUF1365 domain-containing protein [Caenispirillum salinarum]EKV29574.1 Hypothetical protein C882_0396 [Caenispirillum salinarum AK4]
MTTDAPDGALYTGTVIHRRFTPRAHLLRYRVFSLLADLDALPALDTRLRLFGHNRRAVLSLHDRDHGPGDGTPLRRWVDAELAAAGIDLGDGGRVRLLCYPRLWGYAFNPLSVYWCHRADGSLAAVLHEVNNTFGQRRVYLIPAEATEATEGGAVRQKAAKDFYVSPFMPMSMEYRFTLRPPGAAVTVAIDEHDRDSGEKILHASFTGRARPLTDATIAGAVGRHPLMTAKVVAGIHWEALRLWRKKVPLQPRPPAPDRLVTVVGRDPARGEGHAA